MKEGKMEYHALSCVKLLAAVFLEDESRKDTLKWDILDLLRIARKQDAEDILEKDGLHPLPKNTKIIAEVIGVESALALARKCKHAYLYIPKRKMSENHMIVQVIGRKLAEKLQRKFRGELMPIARCNSSYKEKRNEEIRKKLIERKDEGAIAQEYNISLSQIRRIFYPRLAERNRQLQRERRRKKANEPNSLVNSFVRMLGVNSNISIHAIGGAMGPSEGGRERVG